MMATVSHTEQMSVRARGYGCELVPNNPVFSKEKRRFDKNAHNIRRIEESTEEKLGEKKARERNGHIYY